MGQKSMCKRSASFSINVFVLSDEVDEIEVYGSEAQSGTQLATYSFEVKKKQKTYMPYPKSLFFMIFGR